VPLTISASRCRRSREGAANIAALNRRMKTTRRRQRAGGLSEVLPITTWGGWSSYPGALAWSANTAAPAPLANGGLYTSPQSTGAWASQPFPATQYAQAMEASRVSGLPDVFFQQRPADNSGASFSPFVGSIVSSQHTAATQGHSLAGGGGGGGSGKRRRRRRSRKNRRHK
jgi:hypothetical protein